MTKRESNIAKGLGIIFMYFHHMFPKVETINDRQLQLLFIDEQLFADICVALKICVSIFVFITAYGMCSSLKAKEAKKEGTINSYLIHRFISLFSGFWFVYILARVTGFLGRSATEIYGSMGLERVGYVVLDFLGLARFFETPTFCSTWWYMSLAIILILIIPLMRLLYKKIGGVFLVCGTLFLPSTFGMTEMNSLNIYYYLFTCVLGIVFAEAEYFEKIRQLVEDKKGRKWILNLLLIVIFVVALVWRVKIHSSWSYLITNAIEAIVVCMLSTFLLNMKRGGIGNVLELIGKHSMNMFLIHTFIYSYYLKDLIYGCKYPVLIVVVLMVITTLLSCTIEYIKKLIRYDKMFVILQKKLKNVNE